MIGARFRAGVVVLLFFALGFVTGTIVERYRSQRPTAAMSAEEEHEAAMAELKELLDLDDDQVAQIHGIMAKHHDLVQRAWAELRPEVQNAMRQANMEISRLLRPDQRKEFHEWLLRRQARHQAPASLIPRER